MTPLIGLTVFGYLFLIATCLTLWAALTLRDGRRVDGEETAGARPTAPRPDQRLGERPVWRAEERVKRVNRNDSGRVESVPLRSGLPEVAPPDPAMGTGRVTPVTPSVDAHRREPGRTITARKLVVSETNATTAAPAEVQQRVSNDDVRGAKVVVKQRSLDDAFDRFLEVDRKDRGF